MWFITGLVVVLVVLIVAYIKLPKKDQEENADDESNIYPMW